MLPVATKVSGRSGVGVGLGEGDGDGVAEDDGVGEEINVGVASGKWLGLIEATADEQAATARVSPIAPSARST
jgi:hypothetical protein